MTDHFTPAINLTIAEQPSNVVRLVARSYEAFVIVGGLSETSESPLGFKTRSGISLSANSLGAALAEALTAANLAHKAHLLIRESGHHTAKLYAGEPLDLLHLYVIKRKSAPRYVYRDYRTRPEHDLYAAHVCTIDARTIHFNGGSGSAKAPGGE